MKNSLAQSTTGPQIYFFIQGGVTELTMNGIQDFCSRRIRTAWQQLAYNVVVLIQLGVGVGVRLLHGGSTVELPVVAVY